MDKTGGFKAKLMAQKPKNFPTPALPTEEIVETFQQISKLEAERMQSTVKEVVDKLAGDPEHAAEVLMTYLPPESQEKIRQAQHDMVKPLWQMLMGYVMVQVDKEEIWAPYILSQWETNVASLKPKPCGKCQGLFLNPRFPDAQYCCGNCYFDKLEEKGHTVDCLLQQMAKVI